MKHSFRRIERLKSKKNISLTFKQGQTFSVYPIRFFLRPREEEGIRSELPRILVTVPKRKFKHAVTRNLLKRKIREAYRLNKHIWLNKKGSEKANYDFVFLYVSSKVEPQSIVSKSIKTILKESTFK